jgi:hypothetical protein
MIKASAFVLLMASARPGGAYPGQMAMFLWLSGRE